MNEQPKVRPADLYAAMRVIADGAKAAADIILEDRVVPVAKEVGAKQFQTPFGLVYSSTSEAHVEIRPSAALKAWALENLQGVAREGAPIHTAHFEDQFSDFQLDQAARAYRATFGDSAEDLSMEVARSHAKTVLRAAYPAKLIPESIAPWVIPYLVERAKIVGSDVTDSVTGEVWPWAEVVEEKVGWSARLDKEKKAQAASLILEQATALAQLVGVKAIETGP